MLVCSILAGHPDYPHHDVYEDARTIAFLARRPTLLGHTVVAPKQHIESWVHDLDEPQFLALQQIVHRIARVHDPFHEPSQSRAGLAHRQ